MTTKVQGTNGIEFPDGSVQGSAAYTKAEIIETVSNSSGTCVKYADGTMVFYGRTEFTPQAFIGSANLWYSQVSPLLVFPVAFITAPFATVSCSDNQVSVRSAYCSNAIPTATGIPDAFLTSPAPTNPGNGSSVTVNTVAFGRWKV